LTTMYPVEKTCAVCGVTSRHHVLGSTNTMGAPDLDLRPAPMARWTLGQQIQQCPQCGYCAADISETTDKAREVVRNEAYQAELDREDYPALTRRFLCASLILSVLEDDAAAGRAALMGAWVADDGGDWQATFGSEATDEVRLAEIRDEAIASAAGAAAHCRRLAIGYFEADRRRGLTFAADEYTADALLADLHRRVGDFDGARAYARAGIDRGAEGLVLGVLKFQIELADFLDASCHSMDELGWDEGFKIILD
jgi:hypothetical protein